MNSVEKIARHYGVDAQSRQAIEEMAELTQAITKFWRYKGDDAQILRGLRGHIAEEIADVKVMLEQLEILFDVKNEVAENRSHKIFRQLDRIGKEKGETK